MGVTFSPSPTKRASRITRFTLLQLILRDRSGSEPKGGCRYLTVSSSRITPQETAPGPTAFSPSRCWTQQQRSEEHTSELQSRGHLVCRLLLEKKHFTKRQ